MKVTQRTLGIALALVLVFLGIAPGVVSAKDIPNPVTTRFAVQMTPDPINGIDQPVVSQAPWPASSPANSNSWPIMDMVNGSPTLVGWVVDGRSIYGAATGDLSGRFTFTYGGIVDTIQSGSIRGIVTLQSTKGIIYLSASGELDTAVIDYYTFAEIASLLSQPGAVGALFAGIYGDDTLASLPNDPIPGHPEIPALSQLYGTVLPTLPQTLSAGFSGTAVVDDGTGAYGTVHGQANFKPAKDKPLILSITPDQHVSAIKGTISLSGVYSTRSTHPTFRVDKDKIQDFLRNLREHKN